jgi:SEC-C motif-containing protein
MKIATKVCWCESGKLAKNCCAPLLNGERPAATALALMRSRYSAYVTADEAYLLRTWDPQTRPAKLQLDDRQRWLGLKIRRLEAGTEDSDHGVVEFVARFKIEGRGHRLHETSRFRRAEVGWLYVEGELLTK